MVRILVFVVIRQYNDFSPHYHKPLLTWAYADVMPIGTLLAPQTSEMLTTMHKCWYTTIWTQHMQKFGNVIQDAYVRAQDEK